MRALRIQPLDVDGAESPTPFFVTEDGAVQQQSLWNGYPSELLGFQDRFDILDIVISVEDVFDDPDSAVGRYMVFRDAADKVSSYLASVGGVEVVDQVPDSSRGGSA